MSCTVINPSQSYILFEGWHKTGRDVKLPEISVRAAFRLLNLSRAGMTFRPQTDPVRYLNRAFGQRFTAKRWIELLAPVVG
jgi:uncharacterized C2H2 Zn-finger protein